MKRWTIFVLFLALLGALFCALPARAQEDVLKQADAAWNEKSYARALELYKKVLAGGAVRDREEIEYRIAVSLGKTQKWDEAIETANALLGKTEWKARVYYWLGRLYTVVPHQGYKVGGKIYRGQDYPKIEGAEKPVQVYLGEEDAKATLDFFEKAKIAAQQEREWAKTRRYIAPIHPITSDEEIDLNFDLAAYLPQREQAEFIEALEKAWKDNRKTVAGQVDLKLPYNAQWNLPTKVIYLYNEIKFLDQSNDKHDTVLSLLAKGMFVRAYRQQVAGWAQWYDEDKKTYITRAYPFDNLEAIPNWREAIDNYPRDPIADRLFILIAQTYEQQGDSVKALATYQELIGKYPKSKWVSDARSHIQQITKHEISLDTMGQQKPGENAKITINTRNVKAVKFTAYRVQLEKVLDQQAKLNDYQIQFSAWSGNFGNIADAQKFFGEKVAEWNFNAKDKGDYKNAYETIDTPLKDLGAYAIVAEGDGIRSARILLISDLAILKKTDRDEALAFIADAKSGAPLNGVNVILKETYYDSSDNNNRQKVSIGRGQSGEVGFFTKKLTTGRNINSQNVQAFAWIGNRYAMTGAQYYGYYGYDDNREEAKVYSYTDRPVYRPAQKVYFRQILSRRVKGGDQAPMKGVEVTVIVTNPKGENIYEKKLTTSEFGTINGEFDLPAETPLGEYNVQAQVAQTARQIAAYGGNRFRVEEYKRPEFIVSVDAPDNAVKPGETVAAKINAKYYFGSPVPNATVKYTVRRSRWWASYHFPRPFEWLYSYWGAGDYDTGRRNIGGEGAGEIIKEGTVKTDSQGNAEVSFQTKPVEEPEPNNWWQRYSNPLYTIEAEVTDASRRTIEAQGQVRVANQQYFAFLDAKQGYYYVGDRVQIEVVTQDANDKPKSASGKMVVYKLLPNNKEEKVFEEAIRTDEKGRATWSWPNDNAGQFRIAYEAIDDWNNKVVGSTNVWVAGPGLNTTQFRLQGVTIVLDKQNYEEGDSAKVLLIADSPGTTVLFTQEAGGDILKRNVIFIEGKSKEITIPIEHQNVPNFSIAAAAVKDFQVFQAQQEVFVPPTKQWLDIKVKGDKEIYKPGEKGTFTITAKDWKGNPARAEVSVAMIDASLFYIQKDYAPDIRLFYYGQRRANSVNLDSHRSGQPQAHTEDDQKYKEYEGHGWEQPDELGLLNLPPGQFGYYYGYNRRGMTINGGFGGGGFGNQVYAMASDSAALMPAASTIPAAAPRQAMAGAKMKTPALADSESAPMQLATAQVRSNFAETAFWTPAVVTNGGSAKVEVTFPDSLTQWHATARGLTTNVQVGAGEDDSETKKNLLVRLQSPRFFTERDQVVLTANVHNYLKDTKRVKVSLDLGSDLELTAYPTGGPQLNGVFMPQASGFVEVKAGEEVQVNWYATAKSDGKAEIKMTAQTDSDADAVKMNFPILVHGVQRFASQSGVLKNGQNSATAIINLPKERRFGQSDLNVQLNPSIAATMMDALPYLADYPYGCVEQTMSRFLPTVLVQKTLSDSGVNLQTLKARAMAYEKEAQAAPIGERVKNSGYTYPKGQPNSRDLEQMASHLWYTKRRSHNPVYDQAVVNAMTKEGLQRLYNMQRGDGGWGWWPGSGYADEYMSAYVMWGLATAKAAEVAVRDDVLQRGFAYLEKQMSDEDNLQLLTWMAHALSLRGKMSAASQNIVSGRLFTQRERLTPYSQSLLAIALYNSGDKDKASIMVRNLENTAIVDAANGTARWKMQNAWWYWWNDDVETNAWALKAFLLVDPKNAMVDRSMKWLVTKSRANHWDSTKSTAMAVSALNDYVRVNKEFEVDYSITVTLNNRIKRTYRVNRDNMLFFDNRFITGDLFLENGANKVTIEKQGKGNLYWNASSEYFSLEEPIKASGNALKIKRRYFKLTRNPEVKPEQSDVTFSTTAIGGPVTNAKRGIVPPRPRPAETPKQEFTRSEIKDNATLSSGDLIEVELTLDADNDYSYLVFEDMKAAGLEPVDLRSGYAWGDGLSSNVELRDEKVALFVDRLPQGTRVLRYRMRAEIPGRFHALPTNGYAMYAPEVRAISDEARINVKD